MNLCVFHDEEYKIVSLEMVEEIGDTSIMLSSSKEEIEVDAATANYVKAIVKENAEVLFAINSENRVLILNYEVPETKLIEELKGACE